MKKLIILTTLILSANAFSYSVTQAAAFTLAETIYVTALTAATSEVSLNITSSKNQKAEARKIQNDVQNYFQTGELTAFLEGKLEISNSILPNLSQDELVDALLESSIIILNK